MQENRAVTFLKKNMTFIVVLIISLFYIFWGGVNIVLKDLNWWELLCYIATTLVFGVCITNLIGETGFPAAKSNEKYIATRKRLISCCDAAIPYKEEAIEYVNKQIDKDIQEDRKNVLLRAGINYNEIFDEDGKVIITNAKIKEKGKYTKKQKKSIRQAIRIKKCDFTLFAYSAVKVVGRKKEVSEQEYRAKSVGFDFIVRVFLAIISGSIMFTFNELSAASIIYAVFQMILWIASGIMKRTQNYNFIVVQQREIDLDRIGYLKSFLAYKGFVEQKNLDGKIQFVYNKNTHDEVSPNIE